METDNGLVTTGGEGQEVATLASMLAQDAADVAATEKGSTFPTLSIRDKKFAIDGLELPNPKQTTVIILQAAFENAYYEEGFDPDSPAPPDCYAVGYDEATLAPPEDLETKQHDTCAGCPKNEWGSAEKGKGKACKNQRKLALISADAINDGPGGVAKSTVVVLRIPPTSTGPYSKYVKRLANLLKLPPYAVSTTLSFDEGESYALLKFKEAARLADPAAPDSVLLMQAIIALRDSIRTPLVQVVTFTKREAEDDGEKKPEDKGKSDQKERIKRKIGA
jgi:hypothetical protein